MIRCTRPGKVSASTQNQALNALSFLYEHVLEQKLGSLGEFTRARRPERRPVVLSREEELALPGLWNFIRAKGPFYTSMGQSPHAWGSDNSGSANGASHGPGLPPFGKLRRLSYGCAIGWFGPTPLALGNQRAAPSGLQCVSRRRNAISGFHLQFSILTFIRGLKNLR